MKNILAAVVLLLTPVVIRAQYVCQGNQNTANCPPCYINTVQIPNHRGNTADGRQKLNVYIRTGNTPGNFDNPSGSGTTNTQVWNAVFGCSGCSKSGMEKWNDATDTTSEQGVTKRPPYFFQNNQSGGESNADIIIISDSSRNFAESDHAHYPVKIFINPTWAATLSQEEFSAIIAHELGHIALGNAYKQGSGCENSTSIMQGLNPTTLKPIVQQIQDRDVYQMNKYKNNQEACCANVWDDNAISDEGGGDTCAGNPCCGDPCCGDPCCGDPNCGEDCYVICDTYCSGCEAWDPYDPGECMWWGYCDTFCYEVCY